MKHLTKEDVLGGINKRVNVHVKEYDAEIVIRPLSDGEISKILSLMGPVPLSADGTPDTSKVELQKNFEALRLATSLGLVEPKLSVEEVSNMRFGVPEFIGTKILELSGVASAETVKKKGAK